jgi:CRP-like cAMP-binding protein
MDTEQTKARATTLLAVVPQGKQEIVGRSPLASLPEESRTALLDLGTVERLPRRHAVAIQGESPRVFLLIGEGRVKLERRRGERSLSLGHRGPGQMVGEPALAGAPLATESATVVDDAVALSIPIGSIRARLADDAPLRRALTAAILEEHRAAEQRLCGLLLHGVEARLAAFLLEAAGRWGQAVTMGDPQRVPQTPPVTMGDLQRVPQPPPVTVGDPQRGPAVTMEPAADHDGAASGPKPRGPEVITAPFTHAEIAHLIGSTRETVTLVLGKLKREGLLAFDHRHVVLLDHARLERRSAGLDV